MSAGPILTPAAIRMLDNATLATALGHWLDGTHHGERGGLDTVGALADEIAHRERAGVWTDEDWLR